MKIPTNPNEIKHSTSFLLDVEKIETFYTGGGIWLTAAKMKNSTMYYIVNSEWPEGLSLYDRDGEDDDTEYPCQHDVSSTPRKDLTDREKALYYLMLDDMLNNVDVDVLFTADIWGTR